MGDTEALAGCRTPSQGIVGLAEDHVASPREDMHSAASFAEVTGKQDSIVGLKNNNTKVGKSRSRNRK